MNDYKILYIIYICINIVSLFDESKIIYHSVLQRSLTFELRCRGSMSERMDILYENIHLHFCMFLGGDDEGTYSRICHRANFYIIIS